MSNHPKNLKILTRPFLILMKLGVFVECNLTVPNLKFWVNQVRGLGDTAPRILRFLAKRVWPPTFDPSYLSGTTKSIVTKLVLMEREFNEDSRSAIIMKIGA